MKSEMLFEVSTPLGFNVRCTVPYWTFIISQKHPSLAGKEQEIERVLSDPDAVRLSRKDPDVFLFYREATNRLLCVVVKREAGAAFLITAYRTDTIKAGEEIWTK